MKKNNLFLKLSFLLLSTFFLLSCSTGKYSVFKKEIVPENKVAAGKKVVSERKAYAEKKAVAITNALCFLHRCPSGTSENNFLVDHEIYVLSSNPKTKFADWVAYVVKKANLNGPSRKRNWKKDPLIPSPYTLLPQDYKGAAQACKYDRGHQAPLASFSNNSYWQTANYLSNITPQKASLNQGPWVELEGAIRRLASAGSAAYVVTGPIYQPNIYMCSLPKRHDIVIPTAYFKVIFKQTNQGNVNYAAFIMPQSAEKNASMCKYIVPLKKVREMTGLKFLNDEIKSDETLLKPLGCKENL